MPHKIRVMVVDDSAVVRGLFTRALTEDPMIDVVASAGNGEMALTQLKNQRVDVVLLDVEMPVMDGITALPEILKLSPNTRVIMASTLTTRNAEISVRAMQMGASDYVAKPSTRDAGEVSVFYASLIDKIKALAPHITPAPRGEGLSAPGKSQSQAAAVSAATSSPLPSPIPQPAVPVRQLAFPNPAQALAIASSTGGPQALLTVFREFKGQAVRTPIFITQHMPANFTAILADHITKASGLDCHEAQHDETVVPGKVYLAPGDYHMTVKREGGQLKLQLDQSPPENFCRPSADPMLRSLAKAYGDKILVAVLTGLGADGARGSSDIVAVGGSVIAQDEATSVVYGMPKAVADAKLTSAVFPLNRIAPYLLKAVT